MSSNTRGRNHSTVSIFVSHFPPPAIGGAESTMVDFAELLASNGFNVKIHALRINKGQVNFKRNKIQVTFYRILNIYHPFSRGQHHPIAKNIWHLIESFNLIAIFRSLRILLMDKPNVVLNYNLDGWSFSPWFASKLLRIPSVQSVHDFGLLCVSKTTWNPKKGNCEKVCLKCQFRTKNSNLWAPENVIFNSKFMEDSFNVLASKFLNKRSSHIVHPRIKPNFSSASNKTLKSSPQINIGYIGRIAPEKGIEILLESCDQLNLNLLVAGDGNSEYVKNLKYSYPKSDFIGRIHAEDFYKLIDVVVIPSIWHEPFGKVVLESIMSNKTVILSNSGSLVDTANLIANEYLVFNSGSVTSLNEKLREVLKNLKAFEAKVPREIIEKSESLYIESTKRFLELIRGVSLVQ